MEIFERDLMKCSKNDLSPKKNVSIDMNDSLFQYVANFESIAKQKKTFKLRVKEHTRRVIKK